MEGNELKVLIFKINEEFFATDIMEVERILNYENTTKIPDSPDFFEGVINYEGSVLPIINLSKKFHVPFKGIDEDTKIIVSKRENGKIGVIVDVVSEVKDIEQKNIENTPSIATTISKRYVKGLIKLDGKIIIFLDMDTILTQQEQEKIENINK